MKNKKCCIFTIIAAVAVVAAAIFLALTYREEITEFLSGAKEKFVEKKNSLCSKCCCCDDYDEE